MKESSLWHKLKRGMGDTWDATRHEDCVGVGVPDVSFGLPVSAVQGWIELKCHGAWPKRAGTFVDTDLTSVQRRWLLNRGRAGASCWLLMQVGEDVLLYYWTNLPERKASRNQLVNGADAVWNKRIDWRELWSILSAKGKGLPC